MKRSVLISTVALAGMMATGAAAQSSTEGLAVVTIEEPAVEIQSGEDSLDFGTVSRSSDEQTVTVPAEDEASEEFTLTGLNGQSYTLTFSDGSLTSGSSGGTVLTVSDFTASPGTSGVISGTSQLVTIGGTLNVPGNAEAGNYQGIYEVFVNNF